jgi:hypothetical protein
MKVRKLKRSVMQNKISPQMGFQIAPSAPAGGGTNAVAMRPTFSFLPVDEDAIERKIYEGKLAWRAANPSAPEDQFPGIPDLFGGSGMMGAGTSATPKPIVCPGGQRWREDNQRCECPGTDKWCNRKNKCVSILEYGIEGCFW